MIEVLRFFQQYEHLIYFILGSGVVFYGWRFWKAWQEVRGAIYGLEQVSAQRKLNRAAIALFILLVMGFVVFSLVTFIGPVIGPGVFIDLGPQELLPDPALEESLPSAEEDEQSALIDELLATATPLPTVVVSLEGCVDGQVDIISPVPGEAVSGTITVTGSANVADFGFYKFEIARAQEELWLTIRAGRNVVQEGELVTDWDTSFFDPGDYVLQLVVSKNDGELLPPCRVPILIGRAP